MTELDLRTLLQNVSAPLEITIPSESHSIFDVPLDLEDNNLDP
jgi:hypothetical protein